MVGNENSGHKLDRKRAVLIAVQIMIKERIQAQMIIKVIRKETKWQK